ncbi:MAG: efflux RND transporter periplasmic adaptor subunit [Propionivibrio sp.]
MSAVRVFKTIRFPSVAWVAAVGIAFGGAFLAGCNESRSAANIASKVPEVGVVTLKAQPLALTTELSGRTTAHMVAQIRPQVGGIIQKRAFVEGAMVKAGDLLYQIDAASYQATQSSARASVARAEATLNAARLKAQRQSELLAIEAISKQDYEDGQAALQQAQADLASAKAALETATINLERTRITSPISGRVEASSVTPGALVTANQETALTTVQQLDPIYVDIPQSSAEVLQLRKALASGRLKADGDGARIRLVLEDGSLYKHEGKLQFSGVTVNTGTGAVTLRALVPNPERLLLPGMYVRARLDTGTDPAALLVPQQGIGRDNAGRATALVVQEDGKVEKRNVTVAEVVGTDWRVTDGLAAGDKVIVEGSGKVRPGQSVNAVAVDPNAKPDAKPAAVPDTKSPSSAG